MTRWMCALVLVVAACSDDGAAGGSDGGPGSTGTADGASTELPVTSATPSVTSSEGSVGTMGGDITTDPGGLFIAPPDNGSACTTYECDLYAQDCCAGEKCVPWGSDGGEVFNATRCVPLAENAAQLGEPCTVVASPVSGFDSCDENLTCWGVDPQTLQGTCEAMCTGNAKEPECAEGTVCVTDQTVRDDNTILVCLPSCDPTADDCAMGSCTKADDGFACRGVMPPVADTGEPCDLVDDCGLGSQCVAGNLVPDCAGPKGCCAAWCDLTATNPHENCPPGTACVSWYPGAPPAEYAHVGICVAFG